MVVDVQVGEEDGVVGHVAATQVGEPGDVVQRGDEVVHGAFFLHCRADASEFGGGVFGDVGGVMRVDFRFGQRGTVVPELVHQVVMVVQADVFRGEGRFHLPLGGKREHIGGDADDGTLRQVVGERVDVGAAGAEFL